jgi:hypothetical protein
MSMEEDIQRRKIYCPVRFLEKTAIIYLNRMVFSIHLTKDGKNRYFQNADSLPPDSGYDLRFLRGQG